MSYLGWRQYLHYRSPYRLDIPWGWKDPRNTFTLPLWLELFPSARVIHIHRDSPDVARSLLRRQQQILGRRAERYRWLRSLGWLLPKPRQFTDTVRCTSLAEGIRLSLEYVQEAQTHTSKLGQQALTLRYEDLLLDPVTQLRQVADFCVLPTNERKLSEAAQLVDRNRLDHSISRLLTISGPN
ncbi:sulfotransferase [Candidatus Cyanaurora vandensis]|uniref:sulfotransferase family protein n=1 Tax=Candidatus Cyanaurora vandensis TaxID=2714958 RepID=UPI00257F29A0|nr:sulfotransferase [Candidatus Cyanaurora vandensis]